MHLIKIKGFLCWLLGDLAEGVSFIGMNLCLYGKGVSLPRFLIDKGFPPIVKDFFQCALHA